MPSRPAPARSGWQMQPAQAEKQADGRPMITVRQVDYSCPHEAAALVALLDGYAQDPAGGGVPLQPAVKQGLVEALRARPQAFSVIAWADGEGGDFTRAQLDEAAVWPRPVGLINCFEGFSTFACQPLVNVHDVVVLPEWRGHRIAQHMLQAVEVIARQRGACKLTLEVLSGNHSALRAYEREGFAPYALDPRMGQAQFLQKLLH